MNRPASADDNRVHSEAPAEGDSSLEFTEIRAHSQDPAEGPDSDGDDSANTGVTRPSE
ncbi:hypothetical protein [Pseudarthrobacter albicanus]|uniref:hypothetical protein n=1 Tax=Pseudarthrobacter albicanus TaxID=2823873 RepID=UPI001BABF8DE|nr:hypothetical protein [Pseudarthrobacter albicanus]